MEYGSQRLILGFKPLDGRYQEIMGLIKGKQLFLRKERKRKPYLLKLVIVSVSLRYWLLRVCFLGPTLSWLKNIPIIKTSP